MCQKILPIDARNTLLVEILSLLTAMSICLERPKLRQSPQRGQILQHGAKVIKDHLQKVNVKIFIQLRDIELCLVCPK